MTEGKREEIRKLDSQVQRLEKDVNAFKEVSYPCIIIVSNADVSNVVFFLLCIF